jgi:hypothetical protein
MIRQFTVKKFATKYENNKRRNTFGKTGKVCAVPLIRNQKLK